MGMAEFKVEDWEIERALSVYFRGDIRNEMSWSDCVENRGATKDAMRNALLEFIKNRHRCPCGEGFDHFPKGFPWCKAGVTP
jgi:hypothetical protein